MSIKFTTPDDAHWYRATPRDVTADNPFKYDVEACHEVGLRGARKDARIFPSFTSVEKMFGKDQIIKWKIGHYLNAAYEAARTPGESKEAWAQRVSESAEVAMSAGRVLGTRVHAAIETGICDDPEVRPFFDIAMDWLSRNFKTILYQERRMFLPSLGLAGTCDLIGEDKSDHVVIGDWKTVKPYKGRLVLRDSYPAQLSGYRQAVRETCPTLADRPIRCVSLLLNSQEPAIQAHWLSEDQLAHGYSRLTAATWVWSQENDHWPIGKWHCHKNLDAHGQVEPQF